MITHVKNICKTFERNDNKKWSCFISQLVTVQNYINRMNFRDVNLLNVNLRALISTIDNNVFTGAAVL